VEKLGTTGTILHSYDRKTARQVCCVLSVPCGVLVWLVAATLVLAD